MLLDCQKEDLNPAHQPKTRSEFAMHILPRAALVACVQIGEKSALLRAPACVDLADHDLGAIQGKAIEAVAESFCHRDAAKAHRSPARSSACHFW